MLHIFHVCIICRSPSLLKTKNEKKNLSLGIKKVIDVLIRPTWSQATRQNISRVEFCRVGSRVEPVCLTRVKCDTGETHWFNTSCLRDGAGVIQIFTLLLYRVLHLSLHIFKLVLILVISQ